MTNISVQYIGHATTLIEMGNTRLITDPHFGNTTLIVHRQKPLPITPSELPDPCAVLISHTHFDHLHISSYKYISCSIPIIVPEGAERAIGAYTSNPIIELSHYAEHELVDGTKIMAVPVIHSSGRLTQFRFRKSSGYVIKSADGKASVFFCGDSAYGPHFAEIGKIANLDVAILPIGCYEPKWFMRTRHMTPAEAVQAFEDTRASHMIPIHFGTFRLSLENMNAPKEWLAKILVEREDLKSRIHILDAGEKYYCDSGEGHSCESHECITPDNTQGLRASAS